MAQSIAKPKKYAGIRARFSRRGTGRKDRRARVVEARVVERNLPIARHSTPWISVESGAVKTIGGRIMSDMNNDEQHVSPDNVPGAHDADGTMGHIAGTGSGVISGGIVGAAVGGPIGAVIGAVAGGVLGAAAGDAAHHIGDDEDDVNVNTGSGGDLGRNAGAGAGAISGAIVGSTVGPVGTVAGAVAGGMLGAAGGNAAKDMGGTDDTISGDQVLPDGTVLSGSSVGTTTSSTYDTRGVGERAADAVTGDRIDDNTGNIVR